MLQQLRSRPVPCVVGGYLTVYASWQVLGWGGADAKVLIGDVLATVLYGGSAFVVWLVSRRCAEMPRVRSAWRLIATGLAFYCAAGLIQTFYEIVAVSKPYPSLADPAYLALYPFVLAGLLRFPRAVGSRVQRLRTLIDCATVAIAGGAVVWYLMLGPATIAAGKPLETLVTLAYPVSDLILIAGLASVLLRKTAPSSAGALRYAAAGLVFFVVADLVYTTLSRTGDYSGGDPVDGLYLIAVSLFAIAASAQRRPTGDEELPDIATMRRTSWLPWLGVALVFALVVVAVRRYDFVPAGGLVASAVGVTGLVALRQLFSQRELLTTHRDLELAHAELAALATTDPVTLLPNHRALVAAIDHEVARSARLRSTCAVLFLDVDHFKKLNDTFGHAAGDAALREVGELARSCLRVSDPVGRWGGEEFVVLLSKAGPLAAMAAAERLRSAIAAHPFAGQTDARLTCSVGVAVFPQDGLTRAELIESADRAMYAAKRFGRNQTFAAGDRAVAALDADPRQRASHDEDALTGAVGALALLVDERNSYTDAHATSVARLSCRLAIELGCGAEETSRIGMAARLHDIGKVAVPDAILMKTGPLTDEEWTLMRKHPIVGAEVLSRISVLRPIASIVAAHHERWDGTGYPNGLAQEDIPLGARIIAAADAFHAMVSRRPYSDAIDPDAALDEIKLCSGSQFDPCVVTAMDRALRSDEPSRAPAYV